MKLPKRNKFDNKKDIAYKNIKYKNHAKGLKPDGFWYACYNDWYNWIRDEEMFMNRYIHKINIHTHMKTTIEKKGNNSDKLLIIRDTHDFDRFNKKYEIRDGKDTYIDWLRVSRDYGGIEICPFLTERTRYLWYSSWDVGSGCIWNIKPIIKSTELIYEKKDGKYHTL